jgi:CubicO group peptidase (beta-lactamase class C family)
MLRTCLLLALALPAAAQAANFNSTGASLDPDFQQTLLAVARSGSPLDTVTIAPNGSWAVVYDGTVDTSTNFSWLARYRIAVANAMGEEVTTVAFDPQGDFIVVTDQGYVTQGPLPNQAGLTATLDQVQASGQAVVDVDFTSDGTGWVIVTDTDLWTHNVPADLLSAMLDARDADRTLTNVEIATDGRWLVVADQWYAASGIGGTTRAWLDFWQKRGTSLDHIQLHSSGGHALYSEAAVAHDMSVWDRIEYGLQEDGTSVYASIWDLMDNADVPGWSIAIIEGGEVTGVRGYGLRHSVLKQPVYTTTPFPVASITKSITALTMMRLLEGQGTSIAATLDTTLQDIADDVPGGNVATWLLLNGWLNRPDRTDDITLRHLLGNRSGFSTGPSPWSSPALSDPTAPSWEWLSGRRDRNTFDLSQGIQMTDAPGTYNYQSQNFVLAQAIIEDLSGLDFPVAVEQLTAAPLQMEVEIDYPLSPTFLDDIAWPHSGNTPSTMRYQGWRGTGWAWSDARSIAHAAVPLLLRGDAPSGAPFLTNAGVESMFTDPGTLLGGGGAAPLTVGGGYGMGMSLADGEVRDSEDTDWFRFFGNIATWSTADLRGNPSTGDAIIIMMNTGSSGSRTGPADVRQEVIDVFEEACQCVLDGTDIGPG